MTTSPTLFVSGASGKLGRRVVELLLERGHAGKIIAGTRSPEKLADLNGLEIRSADFNDVAGLTAALAGVDRMLIISTDVLGTRLPQHLNAIAAAKAAGVKELVYTSMPTPEPPSAITFAPEHYGTEQAILASGLKYTILRMTWYTEALLGSLPGYLKSGQWFTSAGEGKQSLVTREDCARAAAGALLRPAADEILTVTGPAALTNAEIGAIASEITGKPIAVIPVTDEQLEQGAKAAGVPEFVVEHFIVPFDRNTREHKVEAVTDAVETLWGTKPTSVRDFLVANKAVLLG